MFANDCGDGRIVGDGVCEHIGRFYNHRFPQPCAFWTFDSALLDPPNPNPDAVRTPVLRQIDSDTGDRCHHTIHHLSDSRAQRIFENRIGDGRLGLCDGNRLEDFSCERAAVLKKAIEQRLTS